MDLIRDVFKSRDQEKILSIPLDLSEEEDILYWRLKNTNMYSVKSAYKLLQAQRGHWQSQDRSST